jgi:hypothetical protein
MLRLASSTRPYATRLGVDARNALTAAGDFRAGALAFLQQLSDEPSCRYCFCKIVPPFNGVHFGPSFQSVQYSGRSEVGACQQQAGLHQRRPLRNCQSRKHETTCAQLRCYSRSVAFEDLGARVHAPGVRNDQRPVLSLQEGSSELARPDDKMPQAIESLNDDVH